MLLDATRISDNSIVMLKHIDRKVHPHEVKIGLYFSSEPLASHPRNHCIPIYDVLDIPNTQDEVILVMPLLREYDDPRIKSIGEAVEFFRQVFEVRSVRIPSPNQTSPFVLLSLRVCNSCTNVTLPTGT